MPLVEAFIGAAYQARGRTIDDEACINLFLESTRIPGAVKQASLIATPGLTYRATVSGISVNDVGCRGGIVSPFNPAEPTRYELVVIGLSLYSLDTNTWTASRYGPIANDAQPVTMATNGRAGDQVAICGGGNLYILDGSGALSTPIALPFTGPAVMVGFSDGYFLLLEKDSPTIWFSALEDGMSWDALDFFTRSSTPDNIISFKVVQGRVWTFGSQTIEVFYNSGDADTPFIPFPGSVLPFGTVSPWAVVVQGQILVFVAQAPDMTRTILQVSFGAYPQPLSTPPIDRVMREATTIADVEGFTYTQEGHIFVGFTFPSAGTAGQTWVADLSENGSWHQRGAWNSGVGQFEQWSARGLCAIGSKLVAGDWTTGTLYTLDLDTYTDNGHAKPWLRRAPYVSKDDQWMFLDQIELGIETGQGLNAGQGVDPQVRLSISKDFGFTWGPIVTASVGRQGQYLARAIWRQLGRVRSDRLVIEVTGSDPCKTVLGPGLWVRTSPSTGQL